MPGGAVVHLDDPGRQRIGDTLDVIVGALERIRTCANLVDSFVPVCSSHILRNLRTNLDFALAKIQVLQTFLWLGPPGSRILDP